jgi:hypothetical protein
MSGSAMANSGSASARSIVRRKTRAPVCLFQTDERRPVQRAESRELPLPDLVDSPQVSSMPSSILPITAGESSLGAPRQDQQSVID